MKRIISAVLAATIILALFASCGNEKKKDDKYHTIHYKDFTKHKKAVVTFFNSDSGKSKKVKMKKVSEDKKSITFSCKGDTSAYNMAYFNKNNKPTEKVAFNKCVSGWYKTDSEILPYTQGKKIETTFKFDVVTLKGHGYDKKIHIWKPEGYSAKSDEKFSTIYVLDGQHVAYGGVEGSSITKSPGVIEQVKSMTAETGTKAIVVAIENDFARDYELVPELGKSFDEKMRGTEIKYDSMNGTEFGDFVANTLTKYVQKHYNVYTDAKHTAVTGFSLGGLESFYIAVQFPEKFGTVGSLSPSFWEYDSAAWKKYLSKKSFDKNSPFIYLYSGPKEIDVPYVKDMENRLKKMGYPKDKLVYHYNAKGSHDGSFWRNVFSEFLTAMVYGRIEPLQK